MLKGSKKINRIVTSLFLSTALVWLYFQSTYLQPQGSYSISALLGTGRSKYSDKSSNVLQYLIDERNITAEYPIVQDEADHHLQLLDYDRTNIKYIYPEVIDSIYNNTDVDSVDWSKYAYVLYATSASHMCNAMMIFAELRKFNTRAELVMLIRKEFLTDKETFTYEHDTLTSFAERYRVQLKPTEVIQIGGNSVDIWLSSFTKLMVFNETQYDRIIYMDTDAILLQKNLDELFFIPHVSMAVSTAYWMTKQKFQRSTSEMKQKYPARKYGFKPLTTRQRERKIEKFIDKNINEFKNVNGHIPNLTYNKSNENDPSYSPHAQLQAKINQKNFYTNLYNELPSYPTIDEFDLTNIIMVIEPTKELFQRVLKSIQDKKKDEFDMDLVQNHVFPFDKILKKQTSKSLQNLPNLPFSQRYSETPEFLILPHQVYGTITPELNSEVDHRSYYADAHEQVFAHYGIETANGEPTYYEINDMTAPGDYLYQRIRYLHFSDAPIPKPWFKQKPDKDYMGFRTRCKTHPDFATEEEGIVKPKYETKDCSNAKNWEGAHRMFKEVRKEVCNLNLIDTDEDTYHKIIN